VHRVQTRCSAQKFGLFLIKISASACTDILLQQLSILSMLMYLPMKVTLQSRLLCYARLKGTGCFVGDLSKEVVLCDLFLYPLFYEQRQKNISLGEFPSLKSVTGSSLFFS